MGIGDIGVRALDPLGEVVRHEQIENAVDAVGRHALAAPLRRVIGVVRDVFESTPAELVTDIADAGIMLTGGGALLARLDECLAAELGVAVRVADDPLTCAVRGAGLAAAYVDGNAFD